MKFISVAVMAVLFCAAVGYAAPTMGTSQIYRQLLKCIDGLFEELIQKHKELEKFHIEYKEHAKGEHAKLDECDKSEKPDECAGDAIATFGWFLSDLMKKVKEANDDAATALGFAMLFRCGI